jgi:hypothetical protein
MIRQLTRCPYCEEGEVALDDQLTLAFNPEGDLPAPCPHLAWVEGRYSEWDRGPHGISRVIGSTEFGWQPPGREEEPSEPESSATDLPEDPSLTLPARMGLPGAPQMLAYLRELVSSGSEWPFAPSEPFVVQTLCAEEKATDRRGKEYTVWDVDGWAIFAQDPAAFWAALPDCLGRHQASFASGGDEQAS